MHARHGCGEEDALLALDVGGDLLGVRGRGRGRVRVRLRVRVRVRVRARVRVS